MMKRVVVLYNDNIEPNQEIRSIIGTKSYGNTILKRKSLRERTKEQISPIDKVYLFVDESEFCDEMVSPVAFEICLFKLYSNFQIIDASALKILLEKSLYAKDDYRITVNGKTAGVIYKDFAAYKNRSFDEGLISNEIETGAFLDLSEVNNFREYITSGFDARYFNALLGDEYVVTKKSEKVDKLRKEYEFFKLLPDDMKMWFADVFDYREGDGFAAYSLERYHMSDLALRYVHGALREDELRNVLKKLFYFISKRKIKTVSKEEYAANANELYVEKLKNRIEELKLCEGFDRIERYISLGTDYNGIDEIISRYFEVYGKITNGRNFMNVLAVGHGDLCFSNILYNDDTKLLKLIDPKGALDEEDLYMNPYYDIAKLSHSIQGLYDFFNADQYEIVMDSNMRLKLKLDFDNSKYKEIFNEFLEENRLDNKLIRLYEASLFLSMLPLHMDREKKVLGFILNAVNILEDL